MSAGLTRRLRRWTIEQFGDQAPFVLRQLEAHDPGAISQVPERILAAIAFVADRQSLPEALELARTDWRDLLVSAGLGDDDWPEVLNRVLDPDPGH
jgi:hypothetical protein